MKQKLRPDQQLHNGIVHDEVTFPIYRKYGNDDNLYMLLSGDTFINVMKKGNAEIIAISTGMKPLDFAKFIQESEHITQAQFDTLMGVTTNKILDAYKQIH